MKWIYGSRNNLYMKLIQENVIDLVLLIYWFQYIEAILQGIIYMIIWLDFRFLNRIFKDSLLKLINYSFNFQKT